MNKTNLISAVVFVAVISVVIAILSTDTKKDTEESVKAADKPPVTQKQTAMAEPAVVVPPKVRSPKIRKRQTSKKSTIAKVKVKKSASSQGTRTRAKRVRWPGMKYRMVRVVEYEKIEPVTELRTWSRKQWIDRVMDLRKAGNDATARQYITAYNKEYPKRDLNNYLK